MPDRSRRPLGDYYQLLIRNNLLTDDTPMSFDLTRSVALVSCDSQLVIPDTLFVCKGARFKVDYLLDAMQKGAVAYVSETFYPEAPLPCFQVRDIRTAMGLIADMAYRHPPAAFRSPG